MAFKSAFAPCLVRFQLSKVFLLLPRRVFGLRARSQSLARLVFGLWECSYAFPEAFSPFGSAPEGFPKRFQPLGAFPRIPRSVFTLWERSHDFPEAFSAFGSIPTTFPKRFQPLGAFPRLSRHSFSLWECSHGFHRSALRCLRLFVCSQCSHFCVAAQCAAYRVFLRKTRACFLQKPQKFAKRFQPLGVFHRSAVRGLHRSAVRCLRVFLRKTRAFFWQKPQKFAAFMAKSTKTRGLSGGCPNAHTGIVRAWRGNHTKSFHQEDEPWQRRHLQK